MGYRVHAILATVHHAVHRKRSGKAYHGNLLLIALLLLGGYRILLGTRECRSTHPRRLVLGASAPHRLHTPRPSLDQRPLLGSRHTHMRTATDPRLSESMSCFCCLTTSSGSVKIVERFGKFNTIARPGLSCVLPCVDCVSGTVSMRLQQMEVSCETKSKDNV